jgi:SHS2 domain-containing protein
MHTLLFAFLDELLFIFSTDFLVFKELEITQLDTQKWTITASG